MCESELDLGAGGTNTPGSTAAMHRAHFALSLAAMAAAASLGCGSSSDPSAPGPSSMHLGGQTGGEAGVRCTTTVTVSPLAFDAASPLGFSGADVERSLPKTAARPLAWTDGTSAVLDLSLVFTGTAGYAAACRSNAADVTLVLTTSDGALDESVPARVFSPSSEDASLEVELDVPTLSGSLTTTHSTLVGASDRVLLQFDFAGGTVSGRTVTVHDDADTEIAAF